MTSEQPSVAVTFHEPPEDLARFFTTFYYVKSVQLPGKPGADSLHPEWAGLRIITDGSRPDCRISDAEQIKDADTMVTGPSSLPLEFKNGSCIMWGVGLQPLGWSVFVDLPADSYANTVRDARKSPEFAQFAALTDVMLEAGKSEEDQLADLIAFFRDDTNRLKKEDPRIARIHQLLIEPELPQVSELAERCNLNQRTMERLCRKHFGFPPKLLLRRQRFMRSLAQFMLDPSLGWIGAIDSLYFDQSHFVRDCKDFLGMSPTEYAAADHPIITSFMRERMRAHGSAVQTLDDPSGVCPADSA